MFEHLITDEAGGGQLTTSPLSSPIAPTTLAAAVRELEARLAETTRQHGSGSPCPENAAVLPFPCARDDAPVDVAAGAAALVDLIGTLESIKSTASAAQAVCAIELERLRVAERAARGVPPELQARGVADEVALARRESKHRGSALLVFARTMTEDLPECLAVLAAGQTSEWRARIVADEATHLPTELRGEFDRQLAPVLAKLGDRGVARAARGAAAKLDSSWELAKLSIAESRRCVSVRPAAAGLVRLSALLPTVAGITAFAALSRHADEVRASGAEPRSRGQVMADTLVARLTGLEDAGHVPIEVQLVMTDVTLAGGDDTANLYGYGPVSGNVARRLIRLSPESRTWVRRLFTSPDGGLVAMDSRRRTFDPGLRRAIALRDQVCRTPFCEAPIRHADHVVPAEHGGPTSFANSAGLCERCNYTKELPGWSVRVTAEHPHTIEVCTPTGHGYQSTALPLVGEVRGPKVASGRQRPRVAAGARSP